MKLIKNQKLKMILKYYIYFLLTKNLKLNKNLQF